MGYRIFLPSAGAVPISAWRADPVTAPRGALVVVQEIFGVNSHIRRVTDEFASHGYSAIAPSLFDQFEPGIELGYDADGIARGRDLVERLGFERAIDSIKAAADAIGPAGPVGVVGYCWGGTVAYLCAARLGLPAVSYYGGRTVPFLTERPKAPLLLHFAQYDPLIPPGDVQRHRAALPEAEIYVWPAGHGFNCDQRDDYRPQVAAQAMQRTLAFFARHLQ